MAAVGVGEDGDVEAAAGHGGSGHWFAAERYGVTPAAVGPRHRRGAAHNLIGADGQQVATTRTDEYYFGGVGVAEQLTPDAKYTATFDVCTADTSNVRTPRPSARRRFRLR